MTLLSQNAVSPEKRLLVCCARTRIQPPVAKEIRELAAAHIDWDFLFSEAAQHSIMPLLGRQLPAVAADLVPPDQIARLIGATRANAVRCLVLTAELIKIMDSLRSAGIRAIPYKGPVLAAQAYGDVALREFEDLDIVLRQRDVAKANEIVTSLGYRARFPWILSPGAVAALVPGEYIYNDDARRIMVELHTEFTLRHFPVPPNLDDLTLRLAPVELGGHEVLTFAPEDMLPILCIHGSKHFWERLSWITDVAEFVQSQPNLDWKQVLHRADQLRARRMLHIGLALASWVLDAPLPPEILARVENDRVAASIAVDVERRLLSRESPVLDAGARFHFRRHMLEGSLKGWRYSLRLATVPAEEDWMMMRLPRALAPLYAALRPFRLLRKYGLSSGRAPATNLGDVAAHNPKK